MQHIICKFDTSYRAIDYRFHINVDYSKTSDSVSEKVQDPFLRHANNWVYGQITLSMPNAHWPKMLLSIFFYGLMGAWYVIDQFRTVRPHITERFLVPMSDVSSWEARPSYNNIPPHGDWMTWSTCRQASGIVTVLSRLPYCLQGSIWLYCMNFRGIVVRASTFKDAVPGAIPRVLGILLPSSIIHTGLGHRRLGYGYCRS